MKKKRLNSNKIANFPAFKCELNGVVKCAERNQMLRNIVNSHHLLDVGLGISYLHAFFMH